MQKKLTGTRHGARRTDIIEKAAVAETLRTCRRATRRKSPNRRMSQNDLSHQLANYRIVLNEGTVGTWERGESCPAPQHVAALQRVFKQWPRVYDEIRRQMNDKAQAEPALGGDELFEYLTEGAPPVERDSGCWIETNHSNPKIEFDRLTPNEEEFQRVREIVRENYGEIVADPNYVARFRHALDGHVYCVGATERERALVIKMVRRPRSPRLRRDLSRAQREISEHNIFRANTRYLLPVATSRGETSIDRADGGPITAFRFMPEIARDEASHYQGSSLEEIESVGQKFGQVNNILVDAKVGGWGFRGYPPDSNQWEATIKRLKPGAKLRRSPALRLAWQKRDFIGRALDDLIELVEPERVPEGGYPISLTNLHPRNVFTMRDGGECLLIYDYEEVRTDYPEVANLTFSAHRFCREFIRQSAPQDRRRAAQDAALAFLRGYRTARPRRVIEDAVNYGTRWAKAVNFAKLVSNLVYELREREDPIGRRPEEHRNEVEKFIVYLKELDELHRFDWLSQVRQRLLR